MKTIQRLSISPATPRTIGRLLLAGAICWSGVPLLAQNQPPAPVPQSQPGSRALLTQDDLKEMVGPIALYPDALIALILPASTVPSDVVLGARFVDSKGDPGQAGNQPWDESVKSLVYYPDVLSWMNENLEWTASLGEAFMDQPADVMNAIQSLRATARASGALTDTPQQRVVVQQETIRIIPADPEVIYVPQYDPEVIFVDSYSPGYTPFITFGVGFAVGSWLNYDCDWGRRYVYRGDWDRGGWDRWDRGGGDVFINNTNVNVNVVNINSNSATRWNPSNRSLRQLEQRQRNGGGNARFTTAEARAAREMIRTERRQNNGRLSANALAAARRDALPTPAKLQLREAANSRGAVKAQDRTNRNDTAETLAEARRNRDNATPNRPVAENRRKTPTEAPGVNGQLDAARQARREENRREAAETRQNVRQQAEDRQVERPNQLPTRAPRVESDMPSQRPSVSESQRENRQSVQDARQERQEARQERPAQRQEARQQQPQRQEARPQPQRQRQEDRTVNRPVQREKAEQRPQQQRQEVRPQQQRQERPQQQRQEKQERPQRQEARQERQESRPQQQEARQEKRSEKRSDEKDDKKKKD